MKTILVIDDCHDFRGLLSAMLMDAGYFTLEARCPNDALQVLREEKADLIICDLTMPFTYGKDFFDYPYSSEVGKRTIKELMWVYPYTPIIGVTALPSSALALIARELQTVPILPKPFQEEQLLQLIEQSFSVSMPCIEQ